MDSPKHVITLNMGDSILNVFWNYEHLTDDQRKEENKKLIEKYPFLLPRNVFTDNIVDDYDYSWTLMDEIPTGWRIAFGELFLNELKEELKRVNFLNDYRVLQVKEKYGSLRWYTNGVPKDSRLFDIAEKYSHLSENICIRCGKPDVPMINASWISPYCEDCWIKLNTSKKQKPYSFEEARESYNELADTKHSKMNDIMSWITYSNDKKETHEIDISETVSKIRQNWELYNKETK